MICDGFSEVSVPILGISDFMSRFIYSSSSELNPERGETERGETSKIVEVVNVL